MRPTPIPDDEVWDGARRMIISPPDGDLTNPEIAAVDALVFATAQGPAFAMRCIAETGDLDTLAAGGVLWLTCIGEHLHPFSLYLAPPARPRPYVRIEVNFEGGQAPGFQAFLGGVPPAMSGADFAEGCAQALLEMVAAWRAEEAAT